MRASKVLQSIYANKLIQIVKLTRSQINKIVTYYSQAKSNPQIVDLIANQFGKAINDFELSLSVTAQQIAGESMSEILGYVDRQNIRSFRQQQFAIEFNMTETMQAKIKSSVIENVQLIRDLPEKYLKDVQGDVLRAVAQGGNVAELTAQLQRRYQINRKRAIRIADDQVQKATATFNAQRQVDAGITKGQWVHSGLGKDKRHSHVKAGRDKLVFDLSKGAYLDGEYVMPGQLINCKCSWRAIL